MRFILILEQTKIHYLSIIKSFYGEMFYSKKKPFRYFFQNWQIKRQNDSFDIPFSFIF